MLCCVCDFLEIDFLLQMFDVLCLVEVWQILWLLVLWMFNCFVFIMVNIDKFYQQLLMDEIMFIEILVCDDMVCYGYVLLIVVNVCIEIYIQEVVCMCLEFGCQVVWYVLEMDNYCDFVLCCYCVDFLGSVCEWFMF